MKRVILITVVFLFLVSCNQGNVTDSTIEQIDKFSRQRSGATVLEVDEWTYYCSLGGLARCKESDGKLINELIGDYQNQSYFPQGYLNFYEGFLYFISNNELCKISLDGTEYQVLTNNENEKVQSIEFVDGWIYCYGQGEEKFLYKIRPDGTEKTTINCPQKPFISDDWLYYSDNNKIYRFNLNTEQKEQVAEDDCESIFSVYNGALYYIRKSDGYIYKLLLDETTKKVKVSTEKATDFCVENNMIYYIDEDMKNIYCEDVEKGEKKQITDYPVDVQSSTTVSDEMIKDLSLEIFLTDINISGDYIYYNYNYSDRASFIRIKKDGSKETELVNNSSGIQD